MEFQLKPYIGLWSIWTMNKLIKHAICNICAILLHRSLINYLPPSRSHVHSHSHSICSVQLLWKYSHIILCDSSIECVFIQKKCIFFLRLLLLLEMNIFIAFMCSQNWMLLSFVVYLLFVCLFFYSLFLYVFFPLLLVWLATCWAAKHKLHKYTWKQRR